MTHEVDFDEFYAATFRRVVSHVYAMTGNLSEAEDSVQEAYARAWERWGKVREYGDPEAWVRTVAYRISVSSWRKAVNRMTAHRRDHADGEVPGLNPDHPALVAALRKISADQRQPLVLHHLVGLSVDEIAAEVGAPSGTVEARLARGRKALAPHVSEFAGAKVPGPGETGPADLSGKGNWPCLKTLTTFCPGSPNRRPRLLIRRGPKPHAVGGSSVKCVSASPHRFFPPCSSPLEPASPSPRHTTRSTLPTAHSASPSPSAVVSSSPSAAVSPPVESSSGSPSSSPGSSPPPTGPMVSVTSSGPITLTTGGAAAQFTVTVTDTTGADLKDVTPLVSQAPCSCWTGPTPMMVNGTMQLWDSATSTWSPVPYIHEGSGMDYLLSAAHDLPGFDLAAGGTVSFRLQIALSPLSSNTGLQLIEDGRGAVDVTLIQVPALTRIPHGFASLAIGVLIKQ